MAPNTRMELVIDNLLSYVMRACEDLGNDALFDVIFTFYSVDEIVDSKAAIARLIKKDQKDVHNRNNPNKKAKELRDLMDFIKEFVEKDDLRVKYVSDNYKRMPPNGIECIAPLLIQMGEELLKINEVLPQFADLKCEVLNSNDMIRNARLEINEINRKIDAKPQPTAVQYQFPSSFRVNQKSYKDAATADKIQITSNKNKPVQNAPINYNAGHSTSGLPQIPLISFDRQNAKMQYYQNLE